MNLKIAALLSLTFLPAATFAQYRVHSWESFEEGLPAHLQLGHMADASTVMPFPYSHRSASPAMRTPLAALICGHAGVLFRPVPVEKPHLSLFSPTSLDRRALGTSGRALYQADVFLPPEGTPIPNISLLAQVLGDDGSANYTFYRFGFLDQGDRVFFSFTNNSAAPEIFESQRLADFNLTRPGWHRLQIIFLGQDQIFCAIDGQVTSFSPITEPTHRRLNAGIMVTANPNHSGAVAAVDNLSIQWTPMEVPLPDSPWVTVDPRIAETPLDEGLLWETDPSAAWRLSSTQRRPLLVMFYAPRINPFQHLLSIYPNNDEAREMMSRHVLLKVDANQLAGGSLAQRFNVLRLPTFMILGPDGREINRIEIINNRTTWSEVASILAAPENPTRGE